MVRGFDDGLSSFGTQPVW